MLKDEYLRRLSAVDELLQLSPIQDLMKNYPRSVVVEAIRAVLQELRQTILSSKDPVELENLQLKPEDLVPLITKLVKEVMHPHLRKVINATGVVIHTNLGRSILAPEAVDALVNVAKNYSNLEFNLKKGERGSRYEHVEDILSTLTRAEAGMVVNNNAGAVLLALNTLACGKEVIVSRGELVEIGGAFRIPDVMRQSGATLIEVGTTNKTYIHDYERAITPETALLLKVHTSNFRVVGFVAEVSLEELVALGKGHNIPVMEDLGSGVFVELSQYGLSHEPTVQECIKAGADVVTFSGDKLLGAPQAGIILGKKEFISKMKRNPLTRALRVDKLTLAGLESTLKIYLDPAEAAEKIPTLAMILASPSELERRARKLAEKLRQRVGTAFNIEVQGEISMVGGGALPLEELPTWVVAITSKKFPTADLEDKLRRLEPPIVARVKEDKVLLDMRTIRPQEIGEIVDAFASISISQESASR
ncbi:MAG: L-seryl-tRNA(Sec) selenium transferase [Actinomycetota bacterium]|nr:L-seryl-tRNA(Sec) selenium transferase [Actinomycetota bacterium]